MKYIGTDVGGTSIKFGEINENGEILNKWSVPTSDKILEQIADEIKSHYSADEISGIGLAFPGPISEEGYLEVCVNANLYDVWPAKEIEKLLYDSENGWNASEHIKIVAGNDANVAALGEYAYGAGKEYSSICMVTIGTGIGGGLIRDGRILVGPHCIGGEIGHMIVLVHGGKHCNCGSYGCLETECTIRAFVGKAKQRGLKNIENAKDVIDLAKEGNADALWVLDDCLKYLGLAVSNIACVADPEAFVIGGGISQGGEIVIDTIYKYYDSFLNVTKKRAKIVRAELGNDAGILGAAKLAMDYGSR